MRVNASVILQTSLHFFTAVAQLPPGTPTCAITCYVKGLEVSICKLSDTACLCADPSFVSTIETCVRINCIVEDALLVKNASATTCGMQSPSSAPAFVSTSSVMCGLAMLFTILRVVYRQWIVKLGLGADDWLTIVTALTCPVAVTLNSRMAYYGIGHDIWTLTPYEITMFGQMFWYLAMVYFLDIALLKLAILFFFLRIFPDAKFQKIVRLSIAIVIGYGVSFVFAAMFQCWPISYNWTRWNDREHQGICVNNSHLAWSNAALGIVVDFWMLYLPLSQIRTLHADWKKKLGISASTFVTVVSIVRLASLIQFGSSENVTRDTAGIALWSSVEITTGVICACMPSMRLILKHMWPRVFDSASATSNTYSYSLRNGNGVYSVSRKNDSSIGTHSHMNGKPHVDGLACQSSRLQRLRTTEEDAIQLQERDRKGRPLPPVYFSPGDRGSSSSSEDFDLSRHYLGSGAQRLEHKVT